MNLDLTSLMFNMKITSSGGTPSWGTSVGQKSDYKITKPGASDLCAGLIYNAVDASKTSFKTRTEASAEKYEIVIASLFSKVFVHSENKSIEINDSKFLLLLVKEKTENHTGRLSLKYGPNCTYKESNSQIITNELCFNSMIEALGLNDKSAWFVSDLTIMNQDEIHFYAHIYNKDDEARFESTDERKAAIQNLIGPNLIENPGNIIYYGAPGCGKSHKVKDDLAKNGVGEERIKRVTFFPEYSNCDFVGQKIPTGKKYIDNAGNESSEVTYEFCPGPFVEALKEAYNSKEMVYLVVEELNRGNASAIFGEMFQLLDRCDDETKTYYMESEYPVTNPNVQEYLIEIVEDDDIKARLKNGIYIPNNLSIIATMNNSDQNVFVLDTAFKRRWEFVMVDNTIDDTHEYGKMYIPGSTVKWWEFVKYVNAKIINECRSFNIGEDKRIGKYFVPKAFLCDEPMKRDERKLEKFAHKILEYIWDDVCRLSDRSDWFDVTSYKTLEELQVAFIKYNDGKRSTDVFDKMFPLNGNNEKD